MDDGVRPQSLSPGKTFAGLSHSPDLTPEPPLGLTASSAQSASASTEIASAFFLFFFKPALTSGQFLLRQPFGNHLIHVFQFPCPKGLGAGRPW